MEAVRIYDFTDYKRFLDKRIAGSPNGGRGQLQRLAAFLGVHPTLVSQVLRGPKNFTAEQTCLVAEFFGLKEREGDYLLALVERERAGNPALRKHWDRRLAEIGRELRSFKGRHEVSEAMTDQQKFEFYSSWEYSAVRLATAISELPSVDAIADRLGLDRKRVDEIVDFLLGASLCMEKGGRIGVGPQRTFVPHDSPLVRQHHVNWRLKSLQAMQNLRPPEMAFTMPVAIGRQDIEKVRDMLRDAIEEIVKVTSESGSEELFCLNVDWFGVRKASAE